MMVYAESRRNQTSGIVDSFRDVCYFEERQYENRAQWNAARYELSLRRDRSLLAASTGANETDEDSNRNTM